MDPSLRPVPCDHPALRSPFPAIAGHSPALHYPFPAIVGRRPGTAVPSADPTGRNAVLLSSAGGTVYMLERVPARWTLRGADRGRAGLVGTVPAAARAIWCAAAHCLRARTRSRTGNLWHLDHCVFRYVSAPHPAGYGTTHGALTATRQRA